MLVKQYASESGHWYTPEGETAYTIIGKNGKERNTTLRDAKVYGYLPSVTTIIRAAASPGLEQWKQNQVLLAALTLPRNEGEAEADYLGRIIADSKEQGRKAAERGETIHGALEEHFSTGLHRIEYGDYVAGVVQALDKTFGEQNWLAEKSFACKEYGGKIDLHSEQVIIDFKTKEFTADNMPECYDEHYMQLAAYRVGLGYYNARCANVFVSVTEPGLVHIVEHTQEESRRGWFMFESLLRYWQFKSNYFPKGQE